MVLANVRTLDALVFTCRKSANGRRADINLGVAEVRMTKTFVLHRTFSGPRGGDPIYYICEGTNPPQKLAGTGISKWINSLNPNCTVRLTSLGTFGPLLLELQSHGVVLVYRHFHDLGIKKGLGPEEAVAAYAALPAELFRVVTFRKDLMELRSLVQLREAIMHFRVSCGQKITESTRAMGYTDDDPNRPEWLRAAEIEHREDIKRFESPLEKEIGRRAKAIPECVILNEILAISDKSWGTSSTVVGLTGGAEKFATVAKLWRFSGFAVVGGKTEKRTRGESLHYSPTLRTAWWLWCDSMLKVKNPKWRPAYDFYREQIIAKHPELTETHCNARARRRVIKDALCAWWTRMRGEKRISRSAAA
jgi:hypothetical protein